MRAALRDADTVARLGGDEFAIILEDLNGDAEACAIANKVVASMEPAFSLDATTIGVTTSVGVACATASQEDAGALLERADRALYQAKQHGRNTYRLAA